MLKHGRPFSDKYLWYILNWLLFGLLGSIFLWQWNWAYGVVSVILAFLLTFGVDFLCRYFVKNKVRAMVKEEPIIIVDAIRMQQEKRGYLVLTKNFVLFVPLLRRIKTVIESDQIVRQDSERLVVEITAKFPNKYRVFTFAVLSTKKLLPILKDMTGESLPYKYDRLEKHL
ncbi:hypothetical protein [Evansella tamaricis]|uniref:Uncharacterized protein n=1 Tax=Evansella tamaricis TaxID=2069301 RepID=A0ABS6JB43_9BACI|nr:hypothetical protein [Evansella tamaricis]MBU9710860.1 hypothetical protein [Evansella tamaricis]